MISKRLIRNVVGKFGYEIRRTNDSPGQHSPDLWTWLRTSGGIRTIIDIGANNGDFAEYLASYFNAKRTIAIEPLPTYADKIRARAGTISNLTVLECAVADYKGDTTLFENAYAPASSLLNVSSISATEFPQTAKLEREISVTVNCLDDLINPQDLEPAIMIKVDVQGLEDKVIKGGEKTFRAAKFVLIEMSCVPMYDGQPLFEEVHELLKGMGYRFSGIKNQVDSPATGRPLFMHCLYMNQHGR